MQKTNPHLFYLQGEAQGAPGLRATHCESCGAYSMPAALVCPRCEGRRLAPVGIGERATLLHHTVVLHGADGFEAPYIVGFVRTEEGPTAFVPILGKDDAGLERGSRLQFRTIPIGEDRIGFAYEREAAA